MFLLLALLRRIIRKGALTVVEPDGRSCLVGTGQPTVAIRIANPAIILRLVLNPSGSTRFR